MLTVSTRVATAAVLVPSRKSMRPSTALAMNGGANTWAAADTVASSSTSSRLSRMSRM